MLTYNDLRPGTVFILDGEPYEVLEFNFLRMQQRKPVAQTKIKNLISGKMQNRTFHQNDSLEEAEILKEQVKYLYNHRDEFYFCKINDPSNRFSIKEEIMGSSSKFLKPNLEITAVKFKDKIINILLPVKIDFVVRDAPPAIKGDTAQGGTKSITLENGVEITAPLFIEAGDIIRVNTDAGTYVERVEKAK